MRGGVATAAVAATVAETATAPAAAAVAVTAAVAATAAGSGILGMRDISLTLAPPRSRGRGLALRSLAPVSRQAREHRRRARTRAAQLIRAEERAR